MIYKEQIISVYNQLRDFQRATVDYIFERMYKDGQSRMLVADEVGLGKTWIAKGVIAKAYKKWAGENAGSGKKFNIYYICSNQQLAEQNIRKVNFTKDKRCVVRHINRISLFAVDNSNDDVPVHIYSLTPDTSFNIRSSQGIKDERYIIYSILKESNLCNNDNLSLLLKGSDGTIDWKPEDNLKSLRPGVADNYKKSLDDTVCKNELGRTFELYGLEEKISIKDLLKKILNDFGKIKNLDKPTAIYNELIGLLRKKMTTVCLGLMDADIFIMDEFQRYTQLIETKDITEQDCVAKEIFGKQGAKVLMLSATPFKPYTNKADEMSGENHYKEFKKVLDFLYEGNQFDSKAYDAARSEIYSYMLKLHSAKDEEKECLLKKIASLQRQVEDVYSRVIVRTEKIIASNDPNAMIKDNSGLLVTTQEELDGFVNLDSVFKAVYQKQGERAPSPIDYAKSAPYAMSFLRDYKILDKAQGKNVKVPKKAFIKLDEVGKYSFPGKGGWPHAKLKLLMENMEKEAKLLWCPPTLPYYNAGGVFTGIEGFTKTLVFSAWKLVPKMIATMVSYEAEKKTLGKLGDKRIKYFADKRTASKGDEARKPERRLVFKDRNSMTALLLAYPSRKLAGIIDPMGFAGKDYSVSELVGSTKESLQGEIGNLCRELGSSGCREYTHISWLFPMWNDEKCGTAWLDDVVKEDTVLKTKCIPRLKSVMVGSKEEKLPYTLPDTIVDSQASLAAKIALGSPAVCAYRALRRYYKEDVTLLKSAFRVGLSFIEMFNKPESIAAVELACKDRADIKEYWHKVIQYCVDGNLQAVLDEYIFMLRNDYDEIEDIVKALCSVLTLRTTTLRVDDYYSFGQHTSSTSQGNTVSSRHSMRSHYAAAFGVNTKSSEGSEVRAVNVREAFNSPFKPFVLATTSIGQEGLDFHWYCRRIMHWNLPSNPIDFEQREGRINRFRGLVIRQRVAGEYKTRISGSEKPWDHIFELAQEKREDAKFKCDIVPNWHFDLNDDSAGVNIERIVPMYRFSQDIQRYEKMRRVLGLYRLTFGQPRQEELTDALDCNLAPEEIDGLLINLCPMKRGNITATAVGTMDVESL